MKDYPQYRGMNYEQASREGLRLIQQSGKTGDWRKLPERLDALRCIMNREKA